MATIDDLRQDVLELEKLQVQADRQKVKGILLVEIQKLKTEISNKLAAKVSEQSIGAAGDQDQKKKPVPARTGRYTTKIINYAWDQSDKFAKVYVTLEGVQNIAKENITSEFTQSGFKLQVNDLNNKDHVCNIAYLFGEILPDKSYHKIKTDMVLLMLKKTEETTWPYITQTESKIKDKKPPPKADASKDPQEGLMGMMKQMYEDGDDEMKRTISKAMYESQNKKTSTMDTGMPGMPGMDTGMPGMPGMPMP